MTREFAYKNFWRVLIAAVMVCAVAPAGVRAQTARVVHVYVALADNAHQGIVPVPAKLGDGDAPATNLYWGAAFGVKTFFRASAEWKTISCGAGPKAAILERCVFKNGGHDVYLVADAYKGSEIPQAVTDFLSAAAGLNGETLQMAGESVEIGGGADLVAYVGHDAFMDFSIPAISGAKGDKPRAAIILACASKQFFGPYLRATGAEPLLWTTGLMAPEAYTLKAALDGWMAGEDAGKIRERAAEAYDRYQHCGIRAAQRLFAAGW